ncbi:MAG: VCBS repeat-containing protein [Planctomycetes bacterium]|nr:VCBS repeat-containing protein [Planctomycetota bacterium]
MNATVRKWVVITGTMLAIVVGCNPTVTPVVDTGTGTDGLAVSDGGFSDAPVSPGGTGGVLDVGGDVGIDEVVITEDGGEETRSFFTAFQIDPTAEDTAGPKFVVAGYVDDPNAPDGERTLDLVTGWNQSQPIQVHFQQRNADGTISFRTVVLAGTSPVAVIAGVELGHINADEFLDVVVLVKAAGNETFCPPPPPPPPTLLPDGTFFFPPPAEPTRISLLEGVILVYFNPGDGTDPETGEPMYFNGDRWRQIVDAPTRPPGFVNGRLVDEDGNQWIHNQFPGREDVSIDDSKTQPESSGFTSLVVVDVDEDGFDDVLVALNPGECEALGQAPPVNTIDLWMNPGFRNGEDPEFAEFWGTPHPNGNWSDGRTRRVPITLMVAGARVKDIAVYDVDGDDDVDVVATYPNAISNNISWARNPLYIVSRELEFPGDFDAVVATPWEFRPIGQLDSEADALTLGDIDNDGFTDVVVRSTNGQLVQWFRRPNAQSIQPEFPPFDPTPDRFNFPWNVFTLTEFDQQAPEGMAVGDLTGDGQVELAIAAEGAVFWYDGTLSETVFDAWAPNTIIQDSPADAADLTPGAGVGVSAVDVSTSINDILIVDLDEDGRLDIVATLDRRSGSGLSDDRIVWYRNIRTEEDEADAGE